MMIVITPAKNMLGTPPPDCSTLSALSLHVTKMLLKCAKVACLQEDDRTSAQAKAIPRKKAVEERYNVFNVLHSCIHESA